MKITYKRVEFLVAYIVLTVSAISFIRYALHMSLNAIQEYFMTAGVSF